MGGLSTTTTPGRQLPAWAGMWLLVFLLMAWKAQDSLMNPQFWAEDSVIFFKEQLSHRYPLLFQPYAGYLHVLPRLGAWLSSFVRPVKIPLAYNLVATIIVTSAILFSIRRLSRYVPWIVVLAALVLTPTNGEILGSLTNVHWFTQIALALLCLDRKYPASQLVNGLRLVAILVMGLSGPFSIFVLMVSIGCIVPAWVMTRSTRGDWSTIAREFLAGRDWHALLVLAGTAIVQLSVLATHPLPPVPDAPSIGGVRDLASLAITGLSEIAPIHTFADSVVPSKIWIIVEAAILVAILRGQLAPSHKILMLALVVMASIEVVSVTALKPTEALRSFHAGDRYFYMFKVVFWLAVWSALAGAATFRQRQHATTSVLVAMTLVVAGNTALMRRAPLVDLHWKEQAHSLAKPGEHVIPVNPIPWSFTVTTDGNGNMK